MTSLSARIRRARALAAISQAELAKRVGVQRSAVTQWECTAGTTPSVGHLIQIACETAVCFEWLATGRGPSRAQEGLLDAVGAKAATSRATSWKAASWSLYGAHLSANVLPSRRSSNC